MKTWVLAVLIVVQLIGATETAGAQTSQGRLSGAYRATKEGNELTGPEGARESKSSFYLTFFPDGRVKRGRPDQGLEGWDDAFWMSTDLRSGDKRLIWHWGTYRLAGERGQILFTTGESWNLNVKGYPQTIEARGRTYLLLDPGNALKLEGLYKSAKDDSSISFMADGRVNEQGIVLNCTGSGVHATYGGALPSVSLGQKFCVDKPMSGRYRVANYTLQFKFADGTSPAFVFWAEPASTQTDVRILYINGVRYDLAQ